MSRKQRLRQHAKRREKRQIRAELLAQSKCYDNDTPLSQNIELSGYFSEYAIRKTRQEIRDPEFEKGRVPVLEKAIQLQRDIQKKNQKPG